MNELLKIAVLPLLLTLGAYQVGLWCQKKLKTAIANPILIAMVLVLIFMTLTGLSNTDYQAGMKLISWLLTPATVCLAIPMYQQLQILRKNLVAVLTGVATGAISCLFMVLIVGWICHFDPALTASLLPKSVTSAIGVPLTEMAGGISAITTSVIVLTGIIANVLGGLCCKLLRLTDPVAQGVAFGTSGHVIGTARANEISELAGAVSSLSLVVAGLLTAVVFPLVIPLI